jgi:nucleoside-diphosphate-sugar epimerase
VIEILGDQNTIAMITDLFSGFCYIDARDCAQAFRLAVELPRTKLSGAHVFNIANADIAYERQTTKELVELVFPGVPYTPETDDPREGLISIKKAREMLGFEPKYGWLGEVERLRGEGKI